MLILNRYLHRLLMFFEGLMYVYCCMRRLGSLSGFFYGCCFGNLDHVNTKQALHRQFSPFICSSREMFNLLCLFLSYSLAKRFLSHFVLLVFYNTHF